MKQVVEPAIPVTVPSQPSPSNNRILQVILNRVLRWPVIAFLHGLWNNYNPRMQLTSLFTFDKEEEENEVEDVMKPGSPLSFVILGLFSFTAIKSQGESGFPFRTYPHATKVAVTSLLLYGLFSAPQLNAIIARLGRKVSLYILVGSLAYGLYV